MPSASAGKLRKMKASANDSDTSNSVASASKITLPFEHDLILITGTTDITNITRSYTGRIVMLRFASALTVRDGGKLHLAGDFVTTADDTITLVAIGLDWREVARSVI